MSEPSRRPLWLLRDDLASYVRPFPRDFSHLARLIAEGRAVGRRIVVDPRAHEIEQLSRIPEADRADHYLETWLRPASGVRTTPTTSP